MLERPRSALTQVGWLVPLAVEWSGRSIPVTIRVAEIQVHTAGLPDELMRDVDFWTALVNLLDERLELELSNTPTPDELIIDVMSFELRNAVAAYRHGSE